MFTPSTIPSPESIAAMRATCRAFYRIEKNLRRQMASLQMAEMRTLLVIASCGEERLSCSEIAQRLDVPAQNVSEYLTRLKKRGLVLYEKDTRTSSRPVFIPRLSPHALEVLSLPFKAKPQSLTA